MAPKTTRLFTVDASSGEVRCQDPSCATTQCGQCNKEQNKRKRAQRNREKAAAQKEVEDQAAINQAWADAAAGKKHHFTYDSEVVVGEGDMALENIQSSDQETGAPHLLGDTDLAAHLEQADRHIAQYEGVISGLAHTTSTQIAGDDEAFQCEKARGKTTWNHTTRNLLYNCIAKYNPFAAAVKKDAWNTVAIEMARSTALMHDPKKGDFRVKTDGHGLEVFYARRVEDMNKKTSVEGTASGQAGAAITTEQAVEFAVLQACVAKEKDALFIKDKKRQAKSALDDIRNNKVTQLVKEAALEDDKVKARTFKLLQTKVRAAKLEAAVWEKNNAGLGKYAYSAAQLADIEYLAVLKKDFPDDSDALPESDGVAEKKRGGVAQAIGDLIAKLPAQAPPSVDVAQFAQAFFQAKCSYQREATPRKRTLAERLADVRQQRAADVITEEELVHYEKEIKKSYFMQD
jgi:hypothetical protein